MILVTGGTGLLGAHLLQILISRDGNSKVIVTRRKGSNVEEVRRIFGYYSEEVDNLFSKIEWIDLDILDYAALLEKMEGIERVYHCAAMVSFERNNRKQMIRNNVEGTANIVNGCLEKGVKKLIHVSSSSTIGQPYSEQPAEESMIYSNSKSNTGYSISKFKSEMEVWRGIENGLNAVIINPTIILGPGFWDRGSSEMFSRGKKGIPFFTSGETGFVDVNDVVNVMIRLMDSEITGERFILNSENMSFKKLFEMITYAFHKTQPKREISYQLLLFLSRLDVIPGLILGKRHLTSEQARAAFAVNHFSNEKVCKALDYKFKPIEKAIEFIAECYGKD